MITFPMEYEEQEASSKPVEVTVDELPNYHSQHVSPFNNSNFDGEKFYGGFGPTQLFELDYWSLRAKSSQLFTENLYARGLIRRLVTNVINVGLGLESVPNVELLPVNEGDKDLVKWTEEIENRFSIWEKNPRLCDYQERRGFGSIQRLAYLEALVAGDVLCVLHHDTKTGLPQVQLVGGEKVRTPHDEKIKLKKGHRISEGVELDSKGRQVAFWIGREDGTSRRLPAWGEKSGRRIAWLHYGNDMRAGEVRGTPLLSLVLQSLKEIDRYRDAEQRAAVINSVLAMFIKKSSDKVASRPFGGGAVRKGAAQEPEEAASSSYKMAEQTPGIILQELQEGEEPSSHNTMRPNVNFATFESAVIYAIAWVNEIPPEILTQSFASNYSASRGSVNEFRIFLNKARDEFSESFTKPIYEEWILSEALLDKIKADGLLTAWRDTSQYDTYGAWIASDWTGAIKPSIDLKKEVSAYGEMIDRGFITHERAARELTGTKFSKNMKRLKSEKALLRELYSEEEKTAENSLVEGLSKKQMSALEERIADVIASSLEELTLSAS